MNQSTPQRRCNWRDGKNCQFEEINDEIIEFQGRHYCILHRPLATHTADSAIRAQTAIRARAEDRRLDFDGVTFPELTYQFAGAGEWLFTNCEFAGGCSLQFDQAKARLISMNDSVCRGGIKVRPQAVATFNARRCKFHGGLLLALDDRKRKSGSIDLSGSWFGATLVLGYETTPLRLALVNCDFDAAPDFTAVVELPQRTFFQSSFSSKACSPEDEGRYRKIRNLFNANRARDEEGVFYALEKRCKRKGLGWWPMGKLVSRAFSKLYDMFSGYGHSYERAIAWFVVIQIAAMFTYGAALGRILTCLPQCSVLASEVDVQLVRFTIAQVVKPFELFTARDPDGWISRLIDNDLTGWWLLGTTLHSVMSLLLLTLIFLAVRWRFRRE